MWRMRRVVLAVGSASTSLNKSSVSGASGTNLASAAVSWLIIYTIILLKTVAVRKLQVAILARSSREMSQTVRIDSFLSLARLHLSSV